MDNTLKLIAVCAFGFFTSYGLMNMVERTTNIVKPQCVITPDVWRMMND